VNLIHGVRAQMPRIGTRKLCHILEEPLSNLHVGRDKLFTILRANQMLIVPKRSYRKTTNSHHRFYKHKNLLENIDVIRPEQVWVSDITYINGRQNTYLAMVTDAYSKKIMGYDLSSTLAAEGSIRALKMADKKRMYRQELLIHHSDRGFQYCSDDYQKILKKKKIVPSMTETYDPYANAVAERVNGIIKQEFLLEDKKVDLKTMQILVDEAVMIYNNMRPHLSCLMNTPQQMHLQREIKIKSYKKRNSCQVNLATIS
jgi:putative transposase